MSEQRKPKRMTKSKRVPAYDTEAGLRMWHEIASYHGNSISALIRRLGREEARKIGVTAPRDDEGGAE